MAEPTPEDLARAAEAEAAAAQARAEEARARAAELRRRLDDQPVPAPAEDTAVQAIPAHHKPGTAPWRQLIPAVLAALVAAGLLVSTGLMIWQHSTATGTRQRSAEFAAAARQSVVNLMSIDYASAGDSVQRVLDGSTGRFHDNFASTADDFVKALQAEKIVTKAEVNDTAVESMAGDSAVVLVSATSHREGPNAPKDQQQPRVWRVVLNLQRDGDQIKMSGVEFV